MPPERRMRVSDGTWMGDGSRMNSGTRVVVAMSGGVDSSVAAALLVEQGYDVVGVMLRLWAEEENRCCSPQAVDDARRVAGRLGIPFSLLNYEAEFEARVVDYFVAEYSRGRTPNPCLACNRYIRFGRLLERATGLGAAHLATGHYARVEAANGRYRLLRGADRGKDQSYVLHMLGQAQLARTLFPVGGYSKVEVREMARARDLPVADKDESMELCFVSDDDYRRFLRERAPEATRPGPIIDSAGRELGQHRGLPFYTVGQRRGIGIAAASALYVMGIDVARNALVVGYEDELGWTGLEASEVSYVSGQAPEAPVQVQAQIRYKATPATARWIPLRDGRARVEFEVPLRDVTPGQAVVGYCGDAVLGGGTIDEAVR